MRTLAFPILALSVMTLGLAGSALAEAPTIAPLSAEDHATFHGSTSDRAAKWLDGVTPAQQGKHYLTSNEWNLHLFRPALKNLGGGYMGVGSDQAYLFIGFQRPTLAWLTDYDELVVEVHKIYRAFFLHADTPEAFFTLWTRAGKVSAMQVLAKAYPDDARYQKLYKRYRAGVSRRLDKVKARFLEAKVPCFLTDADDYGYVRALIRADRVRPMVANLLDKKALAGIGPAAKKLGVPIRVLYLSNAEQYWKYDAQYRKNIAGLHFDEKSLIARTLLTWKRNQDYRYNVQPALTYVGLLTEKAIKNVNSFTPARKDKKRHVDFFRTEIDVDTWRAKYPRRLVQGE